MAILLDQCQNLQIKSVHGNTPLHYACANGNTETTQLLLEHSVAREFMSLDSKCSVDITPLYELCNNEDHTALHAMEFILDFSVRNKIVINMNAEENLAFTTPLHCICSNGSIELLKLVFNHPGTKHTIDIGAQNSKGKTLMHVACRYKQIEIVKFILDYSFENNIDLDLNATDDDDLSALRYLFNFNTKTQTEILPISLEMFKLILNHPAAQDINIKD